MSLALSRFLHISIISKNPSLYSTFNPTCHTSLILKKKDLSSQSFHGSITKSLQYNMPAPRSKNFVVRNNIAPGEPPLPSGSPSGSLRNWVLGLALTFILPFLTRKWGPFVLFRNKVEHAMEAIEVVAKGTDEILDEITEGLPENSKLRKTMEAMDEVVEGVAETTHIANEIIDKVEELEEELETLNLEKEEEAAASKSVIQAEEEKVPTKETSGQQFNQNVKFRD